VLQLHVTYLKTCSTKGFKSRYLPIGKNDKHCIITFYENKLVAGYLS